MTEPGITITRVFDAPRERVWREWTEPERFADWFGGPEADVPLASVAMDVREGGAWRLTMFYGSREIHWHGSYVEVVPPERVVFTIADAPDVEEFELITVDLADLGGGRTEMLFRQTGRMTEQQYRAAGAGWTGFFDRLAERLA